MTFFFKSNLYAAFIRQQKCYGHIILWDSHHLPSVASPIVGIEAQNYKRNVIINLNQGCHISMERRNQCIK